jgi:hypothetical protein
MPRMCSNVILCRCMQQLSSSSSSSSIAARLVAETVLEICLVASLERYVSLSAATIMCESLHVMLLRKVKLSNL